MEVYVILLEVILKKVFLASGVTWRSRGSLWPAPVPPGCSKQPQRHSKDRSGLTEVAKSELKIGLS